MLCDPAESATLWLVFGKTARIMTPAKNKLPNDIDAAHALIVAERAAHAAVVAERDTLVVRNEKLETANERLEAIIAEIRRAHFGRKSERITDDQLRELQELHQDMEAAAGDTERFLALNERFHMRLLEIAGNRWRNQMVADLRKVMKLNRHNSLLKSGRIQDSIREHRAIMRALARRDPRASADKMQLHFRHGLEAAG